LYLEIPHRVFCLIGLAGQPLLCIPTQPQVGRGGGGGAGWGGGLAQSQELAGKLHELHIPETALDDGIKLTIKTNRRYTGIARIKTQFTSSYPFSHKT